MFSEQKIQDILAIADERERTKQMNTYLASNNLKGITWQTQLAKNSR